MSEKRIIIITSVYPPEVGGPGVYFMSLKEVLEKRGRVVEVLVRPDFFTLLSKIKKGDVVLAHATPKILLPIYMARLFKRFPLAVRIGGDFFWERAVEEGKYFGTLREFYKNYELRITDYKSRALFWFLGVVLRKADTVVFTTVFLKDIHVPLFGLDEKKVRTITHPILELKTFQSAIRNSQFTIQLLYAGRFLKLKNLHMLLDVFAAVFKKHPGTTLTFIGEGPELQNLKAKSEKLKVDSVVEFKKPMAHAKILEAIAQSDLVVLPSLSEVSPNLLTDALAAGIPMLATRENGLRDVMRNAAVWFDPISKEDFSAKLEGLLGPGVLEGMREKMRAHRYRKTWEGVAGEYEDVFRHPV